MHMLALTANCMCSFVNRVVYMYSHVTIYKNCGSLTKPRPGRLLDPDLMEAENVDSAGLTQFSIQPPTFACSAGPPGGPKGSDVQYI